MKVRTIFLTLATAIICFSSAGKSVRENVKAKPGHFVDYRDNHKYKTVKIGKQEWFAENRAFLQKACVASSKDSRIWCASEVDELRGYGSLVRNDNDRGSFRYVRNLPEVNLDAITRSSWENLEWGEVFGWNKDKVNRVANFVKDSTNATGVMIVQRGKVLLEFGNTKELSYIASCRKSILSMLYGKYIYEGKINLNKTIGELGIDDVGGLLPIEKTATVLDVLKSKSGVYHAASNEGGNEFLFPKRGSQRPGTYFVYNNWDFNVAGYIFEQQTGMDIYSAFEKDIANKIGLQDWDKTKQFRSGDTTKSKYKAYHFMLSTRDMLRIGQLMLNQGKWNNEQIVPETWVKQMTSVATNLEEMKIVDPRVKAWTWWKWGYGLMWKIWDSPDQRPELKNAYTATGNGGQYITVIPSMDMVIALKTNSDDNKKTEYEDYMKLIDTIIDAKN